MWIADGNKLKMVEGDYGISLPVQIGGVELGGNDTIRFTFKDVKNGKEILVKEYTPVDGAVNLEFSAEDSGLFPVGSYVYSLDWYQNGSFLCNIVPSASLKVVDKA